MTDEELGKLIGAEGAEDIASKITDLDSRISAMQTELPDSMRKKLKSIGLKFHTKGYFVDYQRTAVFILLLVIALSTVCIVKPEIVTAFRNIIYEMFSYETGESLDLSLEESVWDKYTPEIPQGFQLTNNLNLQNVKRHTYTNEADDYIKISIYKESVTLSLDNEKYEQYEDVEVNQSLGKKITKNSISTIVFQSNQYIIVVESNLPDLDVLNIAKSIY